MSTTEMPNERQTNRTTGAVSWHARLYNVRRPVQTDHGTVAAVGRHELRQIAYFIATHLYPRRRQSRGAEFTGTTAEFMYLLVITYAVCTSASVGVALSRLCLLIVCSLCLSARARHQTLCTYTL